MASLSGPEALTRDQITQLASDANPYDDLVREQLQDQVASAVADLPPHLRLPLVLAEIAEVPLKDVARVLGLKLGTVKSRVHRARLAVRDRLVAGVPPGPISATDHDQHFCLDLLRAKQEALDRDVPFLVGEEHLCERCRSLFATLDLSRDVCRLLAKGEMPVEVAGILDAVKSRSQVTTRSARQRA